MTLRLFYFVAVITLFSGACQKQSDPKSSEKELIKVVLSHPAGLEYYRYRDTSLAFVICPALYGNFGIDDLRYLTTHLEVSPGATVEGHDENYQYDFREPVRLRVVAEDGSDSIYTLRVGYIHGGWYQDDNFVSTMKMNTDMVWEARESRQDGAQFTLGAGTTFAPDAFGLSIWKNWQMPDAISSPVSFTDVQATFYKDVVWLNAVETNLTITEFDREKKLISGEWDVRFYQTPSMPFNRSKGQFRHFPLNAIKN